MPVASRPQPTLHRFSGPLQKSFEAMLHSVLRGHGSGLRRFALAVPSPYWRKRLIVEIVQVLRHKTILLTPHAIGQHQWIGAESLHHQDLTDAASTLWSDQTAHVISTLPYSCAPILVLTDHDLTPRTAFRSPEQEADRFVRHLVKHGYTLVILDHTCCTTEWRSTVLSQLAERVDVTIIHATTVPESDQCLHKNHCCFTAQAAYVAGAAPFVREGFLLPSRHLLHCSAPSARDHGVMSGFQQQYEALLAMLCRPSESIPPFDLWVRDALRDELHPGSTHLPGFFRWSEHTRFGQALLRTALFYELVPTDGCVLYPPSEARPTLEDITLLLREYRDRVFHTIRDSAWSGTAAVDRFLHDLEESDSVAGLPAETPVTPGNGKIGSLRSVLRTEFTALQEQLRALVIVDDPASHGEDGRFLRGMRLEGPRVLHALVSDAVAESVHPVLLTGVSLICHDELVIPILSETQKIINLNGWDVQITHQAMGEYSELVAEGGWDPGMYTRIVTDLCNRGITHCLIASHALIASGWDGLSVNVVIDCSTRRTSWYPVQQFPPQATPPEFPWRSVNYWDVISIEPALLTGYADWDRVVEKHGHIDAVTGDGWIEHGAGHIDPSLAHREGAGWSRPLDEWNDRFLSFAGERLDTQRAWKVGQAYTGHRLCAFDWQAPPETASPAAPELLQRKQLEHDISTFHDSLHAQRSRLTIAGVVFVGVVVSLFLLLELLPAVIGGGLATFAGSIAVLAMMRRTRNMKARIVPFSLAAWMELLGDVLIAAMRVFPNEFDVPADAAVESHTRKDGSHRMIFHGLGERESLSATEMIIELLRPEGEQEFYLQLHRIDLRNDRLSSLAQMTSSGILERPLLLLPVPGFFVKSTEGVKTFLQAMQARCGTTDLVSRHDVASSTSRHTTFPPIQKSVAMIWR